MGQNGINKRFRGSYVLKIDDRGRVKIPSRYLSILEGQYGREVYLTSINGDQVLFYPLKVWEKIEQGIEKIKLRNQVVEDFIRLTSFWGSETEIDPRGRILIPPDLRDKSKLLDNVLVLGQIDHMVIWNREVFVSRYASKTFSDKKLNEVSRLLNEFSPLSSDE
jgi:MraZ protein